FVKSVISKKKVDYKKLMEIIPSSKVSNYAYHNNGGLQFQNMASEWGLDTKSFSNGCAYGDLDNDGDLDLVINNVNMPCFVYRNESRKVYPDHHYLKLELVGDQKNTHALGAKVIAKLKSKTIYLEQMPMRGFESAGDPRPNLGLGTDSVINKLTVLWPDGRVTEMSSVAADQTLTLKQSEGTRARAVSMEVASAEMVRPVLMEEPSREGIGYIHHENHFVDFDRESLLYHMMSTEGPRMSKGDVNGDGLEDFYIGGAKDQAGALYVQQPSGKFIQSSEEVFETDKVSEDMGSVFFDADNDGDQDLYVCSGGYEFSNSSTALIDRLYINDGKGHFSRSDQVLPTAKYESTCAAKASDFDKDGDLDLFVGVRLRPFHYGLKMNGYLLRNDGKGNFSDASAQVAPALKGIGMITDADWGDLDNDGDEDLLIVGEYMPVTVLINTGGKFSDETEKYGLGKSNGWWSRIESADLDGDGDVDFVLGNHGLNSRFKASPEEPVSVYVNDFDRNGTVEQIICTFSGGKSYPMVLRHDLVQQIPSLKKKYLKYESYKDQTITDIFTPEQMEGTIISEAYDMATSVLINEGNGRMTLQALPTEAQLSPVYGIEIADVDEDGHPDILLGGNLYNVKPEAGRYDASYGILLKGDGHGHFQPVPSLQSGVKIDGEVRDIITLNAKGGRKRYLIARNNEPVVLLKKAKGAL
ncbi:MAG TPA: FG-GAP-like repeat-containing protein, partial [Chryseosolibacter sp.]